MLRCCITTPERVRNPEPAQEPLDVMGYRQQAGADGAEPVSTPQVHGGGPQDGQHLDAVAMLGEVGVFPQQDVTDPVPGVLNRPALPDQAQQGFWAGAQGCQEVVAVIEGFPVATAGAVKLKDPAALGPTVADRIGGLHGPQGPGDGAAVAAFALADLHRKLAAEAVLILDLAVQPGLIPFHCHEHVGALLRDELKKRFGRMQGVRLDQHAVEIHGRKEFPQGLALVGIARVVGGLGDRHTQYPGVERDLVHKSFRGVVPTHRRASQRFAVVDQLGDFLSLRSDPLQHPAPHHGEQLGQFHPLKQVQEGGVSG